MGFTSQENGSVRSGSCPQRPQPGYGCANLFHLTYH